MFTALVLCPAGDTKVMRENPWKDPWPPSADRGHAESIGVKHRVTYLHGVWRADQSDNGHRPRALLLNPFTAPARKISGLKSAQTRLLAVYCLVL